MATVATPKQMVLPAPVVKALLEHTAYANKSKADTWATQNGHNAVVRTLLQHDADPNKARTSNGATPIWIAAHNGHLGIIKTLANADGDTVT